MIEHSHLLFSAGGISLAVDSAAVHCIHDGLATQAEDGTQEWFLGIAVADERLLPITDLGAFLHGKACEGRVVEVARNLGIAGLKIDEVHGVSRNEPDPSSVSAEAKEHDWPLQALAINDLGQCYPILDIAALLQSSRFLNVEHVPA